ncbi:hypothetical protein [Neobacillus sp. Marseille-QA0830]
MKTKYASEEVVYFTYHKQSGYSGFIWAMLAVTALESVGVSFLLYNWNPIIHWIHLVLGISVIVFLIADLKAVSTNPIVVKKEELLLKIGVRPRIVIPTSDIQEIMNGNLHYETDRKSKAVLDLSLLAFDGPTFEIVLKQPLEYRRLFGKSRSVSRIFFTVDDKDGFHALIKMKQA